METRKHNRLRILAIDPGFDRMGLAVLEGDASQPTYIWSTCIEPAKGPRELRLAAIVRAVEAAIEEYAPAGLAIEKLFFSTNKKTALAVGEARGAVLAAAGAAQILVREYSPQEVKLAVTGYGASDKRAVAAMIPRLIALPAGKRRDDELDAIALGIAALAEKSFFAQL